MVELSFKWVNYLSSGRIIFQAVELSFKWANYILSGQIIFQEGKLYFKWANYTSSGRIIFQVVELSFKGANYHSSGQIVFHTAIKVWPHYQVVLVMTRGRSHMERSLTKFLLPSITGNPSPNLVPLPSFTGRITSK